MFKWTLLNVHEKKEQWKSILYWTYLVEILGEMKFSVGLSDTKITCENITFFMIGFFWNITFETFM